MFFLKFTFLFFILFNITFSTIIEKYAGRICNLKEEKGLNECLRKAIEQVFTKSYQGAKEIGLLQLSPLEIPHAVLNENRGGTQLKIEYINAKHSHLEKSFIKDLEYDIKTGHLKMRISNPFSIFEGKYKITGKILALPINGEGNCNLKLENNIVKVEMDLKQKPGKDNKQYMIAENIKCELTPGKTIFNYENLFGNKELSDNMNKFLNENDKEVMAEVTAPLNEVYRQIIENIVKKVFESHSAEEFILL